MDFPFWLIPIIAVVIILPMINKEKQKPWNELSPEERKRLVGFLIAGVILLVAGIVVYFLY